MKVDFLCSLTDLRIQANFALLNFNSKIRNEKDIKKLGYDALHYADCRRTQCLRQR